MFVDSQPKNETSFLEDEIRECNPDLTIAGYCMALVITPFMWLFLLFWNMFYTTTTTTLGYVVINEMWLEMCTGYATQGLNALNILAAVLFLWVVLNFVQMVCLSITEIQSRYQ